MILDFDDLTDEAGWFIDKLHELKKINPLFKCDVFAIPTLCDYRWLETFPGWIELCVHGWSHTRHEVREWKYSDGLCLLRHCDFLPIYQHIFKAPGWEISKEARQCLKENDWILADNPNRKAERIPGSRVYDWTEHGGYHGHVKGCGNGLDTAFDKVAEMVRNTKEFKFISQVV